MVTETLGDSWPDPGGRRQPFRLSNRFRPKSAKKKPLRRIHAIAAHAIKPAKKPPASSRLKE